MVWHGAEVVRKDEKNRTEQARRSAEVRIGLPFAAGPAYRERSWRTAVEQRYDARMFWSIRSEPYLWEPDRVSKLKIDRSFLRAVAVLSPAPSSRHAVVSDLETVGVDFRTMDVDDVVPEPPRIVLSSRYQRSLNTAANRITEEVSEPTK